MKVLTTDEIARAYLNKPESTIAQRVIYAKRILATARVSFEVPTGLAPINCLASALEVILSIDGAFYLPTRIEPAKQDSNLDALRVCCPATKTARQ